MKQTTLTANKRKVFGRKVVSLRREGILPANIYGKNVKSLAISVNEKDFIITYKQAGETNLINITVDKEKSKRPVLATNLQKDPVTDKPLHVDFHQVDLSKKVSVSVPIKVEGISSAVKEKGAVLITLLDEIKIEALPQDLPDQFTVNIDKLKEFGDSLSVGDLKIDKKKVNVLAEDKEAIVMVQEPKKEEEVKPEEETEEQVEGESTDEEEEEKTEEPTEDQSKEEQSESKDKKSK